jgi:trk system potassium uptake protein TrkH
MSKNKNGASPRLPSLRSEGSGRRNGRPIVGQTGSDTIAKPARVAQVTLVAAKHALLFPLVYLPPMIVALVEREWRLSVALALPAILGVTLWAAVYRVPLPRDLRQIEAVVVLAFLFLLAPLFSVPAFMTLGMPLLDGLFEGMSAITTTGLSIATRADDWPFAGHLLRSWMQWCGGLAMATAVLAMLIGPGAGARVLGKVSLDEGDRIASTRNRARQLLGAYTGLTLVFGALISASTGSLAVGGLLTLSAVSTGGFAVLSDSLASYGVATQCLVIAASVMGAVSLLAIALAARGDWRGAWDLGSAQRLALWALGSVAVLMLVLWRMDSDEYLRPVLNLLSALSTAGFAVGDMPQEPLLLVIFCAVMVVGGDVGSTAGGLKIARLSMMMRTARYALRAPRLPDNAVAPLRQHGSVVRDRQLIALLALAFFYAGFLLLLWAGFLAEGHPPLPALFDTISALSTVGLSTGVISAGLSDELKAATIFAMWLGRLEFIAVLLIFMPRTWIHPSKGH